MNPRATVVPVVAAALVLVASIGGSSPAAHPGPTQGTLDLLASAHPTAVEPAVTDAVHDVARVRGRDVEADTAALASTTCDGCTGESTALHVVYLSRPQRADLDNVATAWAQECTGCTSTALSVQVVVVRGARRRRQQPRTVVDRRLPGLSYVRAGLPGGAGGRPRHAAQRRGAR